jgi:hypothetical protein
VAAHAASVLLRFLLTMFVLATLVFLTLRTPLAWIGYVAIVCGAVVLFVLGILVGFSVRRLR